MARYISAIFFILLSAHLATAAVLAGREPASPTPTYTYTKDTIVKPTANARYQVGIPIDVVWYVPETVFNQNAAEAFNVTIALDGEVARELSNSVSFPSYGEQETKFIPDKTWPESNKYQIFIFKDFGTKTLTSPYFGIWGGGNTATPTLDVKESSSTTTSRTSGKSPPSTTTGSELEASVTSNPESTISSIADPHTTSTRPVPSSGVSGSLLGAAIGGSITGTLAIVGLIWFMRRSMAKSRVSHGSYGHSNSNGNHSNSTPQPPQNSGKNGNQQWLYKQMDASSTTTVNVRNEYKGFVPPTPPPPFAPALSEMPTQMHHEPVELYSMPQRDAIAEVPGDMKWNVPSAQPPPPSKQQQQPQRYIYSPQSYDR